MSVRDVFKNSFLESINMGDVSVQGVLTVLAITCIYAAYIFCVYRMVTRKTFYNKDFNISLAAIAVIVASIIVTIQSSLVVSLGMVGALSIVRFRTAIKDPMDLTFLFWSISTGIICGAGLPGIALAETVVLTLLVLILNALPGNKAPMLLVVNAKDKAKREEIMRIVAARSKSHHVKAQTVEPGKLDLVIELRSNDYDKLVDEIGSIDSVIRCSVLSHDGEVTF